MILRAFLLLVLLAGCGRKLTDTELAFDAGIHGASLDTSRVRLVDGAPVGAVTFHRKARPRVTCRERILPPPRDEIVTTRPAAVTLFNHIYFSRDWYARNYAPGYPDRLYLLEAMLLAHELTHVWQWQHRDVTGYSPLRAAAEHGAFDDPYLFDLNEAPAFLDFAYEQQASIVEEYVCCRAVAPQGARTQRLHELISQAIPLTDLPQSRRESDVYLPWKDADLKGVCD